VDALLPYPLSVRRRRRTRQGCARRNGPLHIVVGTVCVSATFFLIASTSDTRSLSASTDLSDTLGSLPQDSFSRRRRGRRKHRRSLSSLFSFPWFGSPENGDLAGEGPWGHQYGTSQSDAATHAASFHYPVEERREGRRDLIVVGNTHGTVGQGLSRARVGPLSNFNGVQVKRTQLPELNRGKEDPLDQSQPLLQEDTVDVDEDENEGERGGSSLLNGQVNPGLSLPLEKKEDGKNGGGTLGGTGRSYGYPDGVDGSLGLPDVKDDVFVNSNALDYSGGGKSSDCLVFRIDLGEGGGTNAGAVMWVSQFGLGESAEGCYNVATYSGKPVHKAPKSHNYTTDNGNLTNNHQNHTLLNETLNFNETDSFLQNGNFTLANVNLTFGNGNFTIDNGNFTINPDEANFYDLINVNLTGDTGFDTIINTRIPPDSSSNSNSNITTQAKLHAKLLDDKGDDDDDHWPPDSSSNSNSNITTQTELHVKLPDDKGDEDHHLRRGLQRYNLPSDDASAWQTSLAAIYVLGTTEGGLFVQDLPINSRPKISGYMIKIDPETGESVGHHLFRPTSDLRTVRYPVAIDVVLDGGDVVVAFMVSRNDRRNGSEGPWRYGSNFAVGVQRLATSRWEGKRAELVPPEVLWDGTFGGEGDILFPSPPTRTRVPEGNEVEGEVNIVNVTKAVNTTTKKVSNTTVEVTNTTESNATITIKMSNTTVEVTNATGSNAITDTTSLMTVTNTTKTSTTIGAGNVTKPVITQPTVHVDRSATVRAVQITPDGSIVVVAGTTVGYDTSSPEDRNAGGDMDGFILKIDAETGEHLNGTVTSESVVAILPESSEAKLSKVDEEISGICVSNDAIYVVGHAAGGQVFDIFVIKFDMEFLRPVWRLPLFGATDDFGGRCSISQDGKKVYVSGTVKFGGHLKTNDDGYATETNGGDDVFVLSVNADNGILQFLEQIGSSYDDSLSSETMSHGGIVLDDEDNVVVVGNTVGSLMGPREGSMDIFIMSFLDGGEFLSPWNENNKESSRFDFSWPSLPLAAKLVILILTPLLAIGLIVSAYICGQKQTEARYNALRGEMAADDSVSVSSTNSTDFYSDDDKKDMYIGTDDFALDEKGFSKYIDNCPQLTVLDLLPHTDPREGGLPLTLEIISPCSSPRKEKITETPEVSKTKTSNICSVPSSPQKDISLI